MACQFFICHRMEMDREAAEAVCALLEHPGVTCWIAPDSIPPGESYAVAIHEGIQASDVVVVVFSKSTDASPDILSELTLARRHGKRIVPVRVEKAEAHRLAYFLSAPNWVDLYGKSRARGETALKHLALEIRGPYQEGPPDPAAQVEQVPVPQQAEPASASPVAWPLAPAASPPAARRRREATAAPAVRQRRLKDPQEEYARLQKQLDEERALVEQKQAASAERMWDLGASCCRRKQPNFRAAREWFDKASRAGKKDGRAERKLYEEGAAAGSIDAIVSLGLLLESGERVAKDVARAKPLYEKAAEAGDAVAMWRLGVIAMNGLPPHGAPNYGTAQAWLRQAAALGNADAMWEMGNWFERKHDTQNAQMWFQKARARRRAQERKTPKRKEV